MKKIGNLLWGLVFIVLGLIFALNALGIANINIFFKILQYYEGFEIKVKKNLYDNMQNKIVIKL